MSQKPDEFVPLVPRVPRREDRVPGIPAPGVYGEVLIPLAQPESFEERLIKWADARIAANTEVRRLRANLENIRADLERAEERLRIAENTPMPEADA